MLDKAAPDQGQFAHRTMQRPFRRGCEEIAHQPWQKRRQVGELVAHLWRAIQCVSEDFSKIAGKHIGEHRGTFDHAGIAETGLFPGEFVPVDQDHIPTPPLQVQGSADADHARTQYENVGLEFRHPALPSSVTRLRTLSNMKLAIAASPRKPARLLGNRACAAAKLWQHGSVIPIEIAEKEQRATAENVNKCRYVKPCLQRPPSRSSLLRCRRHRRKAGRQRRTRPIGASTSARASNSRTAIPSPPTTWFSRPTAFAPKAPTCKPALLRMRRWSRSTTTPWISS